MVEVKLLHETPSNVMAIVAELRENNLQQHVDFDFAYYPPQFTDGSVIPRCTVFRFYKDSVASWFALKYINN